MRASLGTVVREWGRMGLVGFGGPPAHVVLLRELCVERRRWMDSHAFTDAWAACNLLPGPSSTQLAIFCAHRAAGARGALVGGAVFILPGLLIVLALAALTLQDEPPTWVLGAAAGAGAAVVAVVAGAGLGLVRASLSGEHALRRAVYLAAGAAATVALGPAVVLVLLLAGLAELTLRRTPSGPGLATLPALIWMAFKVGALSYGGGFVIIPLMLNDAVAVNGWLSEAEFLNAVALGQLTPGPVVQTVAAVGYAAAGVPGGLLASLVAFGPSFVLVIALAGRFERLRGNASARAFLDGAGPAAVGAILGAAVVLAGGISEPWQALMLGAAALALLTRRVGAVAVLLAAAAVGVAVGVGGGPLLRA